MKRKDYSVYDPYQYATSQILANAVASANAQPQRSAAEQHDQKYIRQMEAVEVLAAQIRSGQLFDKPAALAIYQRLNSRYERLLSVRFLHLYRGSMLRVTHRRRPIGLALGSLHRALVSAGAIDEFGSVIVA